MAMQAVKTWLDGQHRHPHGRAGRVIGARMARQHAPETRWALGLLALTPEARFLDAGCGAGAALDAARAGLKVGMDLSATMAAVAAKRQGAQAVLADLAAPPFALGSFDAILSVHTFYFWPDQIAVAQGLVALLRPGGRLVAVFATERTHRDGRVEVWPTEHQAQTCAATLGRDPGLRAALASGPAARGYNSRALIVERMATG